MNRSDFAAMIAPGAQEGYSQYGILPSITLGQAILESSTSDGPGTSYSANYDKNLFGIKMPGAKPPGITIVQGSYATDDGGYYRRYQSWDDSVIDHGFFLANNSRYANIIGDTSYISVANKLQTDGYAQAKNYASLLISIIESSNLTQYDNGSYTGKPVDSSGTSAVPTTQYGIVPNSTWTSSDILYGRRCRVIVSSLDGETALDVSNLRVVFNCIKTAQLQPQFSTIVIYNLSPESENTIIQEGYRVTLEAGYEGSQYGLIFDGNVVQAIRNKEDGTTYTLTLVAADSDRWMSYSISNFSMVRGQNNRTVLEALASKATVPTQLGSISDNLSTSTLTRGKVIFGLTRDYIRQIGKSEIGTPYIENGKINLVKANDIPDGQILDISPDSGLIGVPEQQDYGVTIRCLMNPQIKLNSLVHVDNTLVRAQQFDQGQQIYALDRDGIYRVIQLTYMGDTRGNDWYTEVETVTQAGVIPDMIVNPSQSTQ